MLGVSSLCLIGHKLKDALEYLSKETDYVEIVSEGFHDVKKYGNVLDSFDLKYSIHLPFIGLDIANIRDEIRMASLKIMEDSIDASIGQDPLIYVAHPGMIAAEHLKGENIEAFKKSVQYLSRLSSEYSVNIALENMPLKFLLLTQPDELRLIDGLKFCLDVGHANITKNLDEFLCEDIDHLHIHDNKGVYDDHLRLGSGNIDFKLVLERLKSKIRMPNIVLELNKKEDVDPSIKLLKPRWLSWQSG
ncbi:MAG: sugar phosphate isomerase/epimerase [Candidatus Methanoliparum thermophilum]|uniref:Sugar phosphate isomerase/epimerase n=1 Tax=Methanoliparum thermophilum TaxID=2491083 RepID=A0A520KQT4_METT2|nr:MAG: sugar phosphate isomerase/epimerase [Candidatus Methanoliparum thermophilum]